MGLAPRACTMDHAARACFCRTWCRSWLGVRIRSVHSLLVGIAGVGLGAAPGRGGGSATAWHLSCGSTRVTMPASRAATCISLPTLCPQSWGLLPARRKGEQPQFSSCFSPLSGAALGYWRHNTAISLLCLSALLVPLVVAISRVLMVPAAGRYATFTPPAVAGVLGWAMSRHRALAALSVAVISLWTVTTIWRTTNGLHPIADPTFGTEVKQLGNGLEHDGRSSLWADYWISYLLSAATQERVTAAALAPPVYRRERSYELAALRPRQTTVVLFAGRDNDRILGRQPGLPPFRRTLLVPMPSASLRIASTSHSSCLPCPLP